MYNRHTNEFWSTILLLIYNNLERYYLDNYLVDDLFDNNRFKKNNIYTKIKQKKDKVKI